MRDEITMQTVWKPRQAAGCGHPLTVNTRAVSIGGHECCLSCARVALGPGWRDLLLAAVADAARAGAP